MNRLFTVLEPTEAQDTFGEVDTTYAAAAPAKTFWGSLEADNGTEAFAAFRERSVQVYRIRTRHRTDITAKKRVSEGGVTYDIVSPASDPDGRRTEIQFMVAVRV